MEDVALLAAGRIMFERGLRLSQEVSGLKSLQQQAQCYLSTLNTLRLVRPECAWIIKPAATLAREKEIAGLSRVPEHDDDDTDSLRRTKQKSKITGFLLLIV